MATTARRSRSRRGEGDKLRDEILDATERLLVETGNENAVAIRAITDQVGCTPPAIYMHFSDKDELIMQVCSRRFLEFDRFIEGAAQGVEDPLEALRLRGKAYINFGVAHPEHYKVLMMTAKLENVQFTADSPGMSAFQHVVDAVQRCIDANVIQTEHGALPIAMTLWSAVHGITALMITFPKFEILVGGPENTEKLIELLLDVQMEGLLAV